MWRPVGQTGGARSGLAVIVDDEFKNSYPRRPSGPQRCPRGNHRTAGPPRHFGWFGSVITFPMPSKIFFKSDCILFELRQAVVRLVVRQPAVSGPDETEKYV